MSADKQYWDKRANKTVKYKGELFYTITPIPYYYERRKILLKHIKHFFTEFHAENILDLGCGDGEYIYQLYERGKRLHGVDISAEMIKLATEKCRNCNISFEVSGDGVHERNNFDIAYIISVLAHVDDNTADILLKSAHQSIARGGGICIFEQVGPNRMEGDTYIRRTCQEYYSMLEKQGFRILYDKCIRVDFALHRQLFERRISKLFYKKYAVKSDNYRIECNNNKLFRFLSRIFTVLSRNRVHASMGGWGYCFICAKKV